ncbi:MAG TPA: MFS transporter [Acidimicrobiales bacterium]|nr:MFS transporter [Acidimicrobiales bacterium]
MTDRTTFSERVGLDQLPARAGRREWIGLAVIALPCLLYSMDLTVLNLAVPSLAADLQPTSSQLLWIVDIYGFFVAGSLVTMGTLGDRIGRRRLLLIGAAAFGLLSVVAAFSPNAEALIVVRALLGVAGATLAPSTLSLIRNMFHDPHQRTFAIGIWIASFSAGAALGPVLGGVLLDRFWWGSVFLLAVPVMALLLVLGPTLLPEFRDPDAGRLDLVSAVLSLVAVLCVIYGIKELAQQGWSITPVVAMTVGVALGLLFVRRQQTLAHPFIDLRLFRSPAFRAALGVNTFSFVGLTGAFLFTAQYLQLVAGLSPLQAGLRGLPSAAAFVIGSLLAPHVVRRFRPVTVVSVSLAVAAVGFAMLTRAEGGELSALVAGSVLFALALTPVITLSTDMIVSIAPPERAGAAAAVSETSVELGGALGIAILGSIGTGVYRARITDALPASLPTDAARHAGDTLAGALTAAADLPGRAGADLVAAARDAFVHGMHVAVAVGAGLTLTIAAIAAVFLRGVHIGEETADDATTLAPTGRLQAGGPCPAPACAGCG